MEKSIEVRLFPQSIHGGFESKEDLRSWLNRGLRNTGGIYHLTRLYTVSSNSLILFEMEGTIVGCAVVREAPRKITKEEQDEAGEDWKAVMVLDPETIWVWQSEQDVGLKEVEITFRPGPPMTLTTKDVVKIFQLVASREN